uniref:Phosvitin n=1 Tax=Leptobrachium leishanense TaxID=445787 RepID=A0A8C5QER8_9ANUR
MRRIILTLLLALAAVSGRKLAPFFSENKNYVYNYEAIVLTGISGKGLTQAGIKLTGRVEISPFAQRMYLMKVHSPEIKEFNGVWPRDSFTRSTKLSQAIAEELTKLVKFEYHDGEVKDIFAEPGVSETVLNIQRGILHMFHVNTRDTQNVYRLQENGLGGVCETLYEIQEEKRSNKIYVIKSRNLNKCEDKVSKTTGVAFLEPCLLCQQKAKHLRGSAVFTYEMKKQDRGLFIKEATGKQIYRASPFYELHGAVNMEARQVLTWVETKTNKMVEPHAQLVNRGGINYRFDSEFNQMPFHLTKVKNLESLITDFLHHLVQNNEQQVQAEAPAKFLQFIQHLRSCNTDLLLTIWKQFANRPQHRRWLRNAFPIVGSTDAMRALEHIIRNKELSIAEAQIALALAAQHMRGSQRNLQMLKALIVEFRSQDSRQLLKAALLAYGTITQKYCALMSVCPETVLQTLHDFAAEAVNKARIEDMEMAIKALGNAGQPDSIKQILKVLPGFTSSAAQFPVRIQVDAVMALRNVAKKFPQKVQDILLQVFADPRVHPEARMMACVALFETKPPLTIVTTVANIAMKEGNSNRQLLSFTYSHLKSLAKSTVPGLHKLAANSKIALDILNPVLDKLSLRYSKAFRVDFFNYPLMAGASASVFVMNGPSTTIPAFILAKIRGTALGMETDLLEVSLRAEGLQEVLRRQNINFKAYSVKKLIIKIIQSILSKRPLVSDVPIFSAQLKLYGQEVQYGLASRDLIQNVIKALNEPAQSHSLVKDILHKILKGITGSWAFPVLTAEVRHIVPTCTGLPLEVSLHSAAVANVAVESDVKVNPPPSNEQSIAQLLQSNIQVNADIAPSATVHSIAFMGVNTPFIQSGVEHHGKVQIFFPAKFTAKIYMNEKNIKVETAPLQQNYDVFIARSQAMAVSRNAEEPDAVKKTPIVPYGSDVDYVKAHFEKRGKSYLEESIEKDLSAEIESKRFPNLFRLPKIKLPKICIKVPGIPIKVCLDKKKKKDASTKKPEEPEEPEKPKKQKKYFALYQAPESHEAVVAANKHGYLYQAIGDDEIKVSVSPHQPDPLIEKMQFELTAGEKAASKIRVVVGAGNEDAEQLDETAVHRRLREILGIVDYQARNESFARKRTTAKESAKEEPPAGDVIEAKVKKQKRSSSSSSSSSARTSSVSSSSQNVGRSRWQPQRHGGQAEAPHSAVSWRRRASVRPAHNAQRSSSSSSSSSGTSGQRSSSHSEQRGSSSSSSSSASSSASNYRNKQKDDSRRRQSSRQEAQQRNYPRRHHGRPDSELQQVDLEIYDLKFKPSRFPRPHGSNRVTSRRGSGRYRASSSSSSSSSFSSSSSAASRRSSQHERFMGDKRTPSLVASAQAVRSDKKKQGFQLIAFAEYLPSRPRVQAYIVDIAGQSRSRVCVEARVENPHAAQVNVKWGPGCQQYKLSLKAKAGRLGNQPALAVKVSWPRIPSVLKSMSKGVYRFIPGAAYMLGAYERYQKNPSRQAKLILSLASPRIMNAILRIPGNTLYYPSINIPVAISAPYHPQTSAVQLPNLHLLSEVPSSLVESLQGRCSVANEQITTFNGIAYNYSMDWSCYNVLAVDCSADNAFLILSRNSVAAPGFKDIDARIGDSKIEMSYTPGELMLRVDNVEITHDRFPYKVNDDPSIEISKEDDVLIVNAKEFGLERISYNGEISQIDTSAWMRGKTCGMCGRHDDEIEQEFEMPNGLIAKDAKSFADSWSLIDDTCTGACKMEHETISLVKEDLDSTCYSVHPVLRCSKGCAPTKVAPVPVDFHCKAADESLDEQDLSELSVDQVETVDAHVACA